MPKIHHRHQGGCFYWMMAKESDTLCYPALSSEEKNVVCELARLIKLHHLPKRIAIYFDSDCSAIYPMENLGQVYEWIYIPKISKSCLRSLAARKMIDFFRHEKMGLDNVRFRDELFMAIVDNCQESPEQVSS